MKTRSLGLAAAALLALACAQPAAAQTLSTLSLKDATGATQAECVTTDGSGRLYPCHLAFGWTGSAPKAWTMDANGYGGVNVFSSALPAGAATSALQTTTNTSLAAIAGYTKPVTSFASITVGTAFSPGLGVAAVCTASGSIVLQASDGSQITVPVNAGFNQFGFAVAKVVSSTASCTFTALN